MEDYSATNKGGKPSTPAILCLHLRRAYKVGTYLIR